MMKMIYVMVLYLENKFVNNTGFIDYSSSIISATLINQSESINVMDLIDFNLYHQNIELVDDIYSLDITYNKPFYASHLIISSTAYKGTPKEFKIYASYNISADFDHDDGILLAHFNFDNLDDLFYNYHWEFNEDKYPHPFENNDFIR